MKIKMENKNIKNLAILTKKIGSYKPKEVPTKPEYQPSKRELAEPIKLDLLTMEIRDFKNNV